MLPSAYGRETDGTPSYPYITGYLQGTISVVIGRFKGRTFSTEENLEYLQKAFDQAEAWTIPFDSPAPTTNIHAAHIEEEE